MQRKQTQRGIEWRKASTVSCKEPLKIPAGWELVEFWENFIPGGMCCYGEKELSECQQMALFNRWKLEHTNPVILNQAGRMVLWETGGHSSIQAAYESEDQVKSITDHTPAFWAHSSFRMVFKGHFRQTVLHSQAMTRA